MFRSKLLESLFYISNQISINQLDLELIMSSLRMDLEKEWISIGMDLEWDLKILNFEFYDFKNFDSKTYYDF